MTPDIGNIQVTFTFSKTWPQGHILYMSVCFQKYVLFNQPWGLICNYHRSVSYIVPNNTLLFLFCIKRFGIYWGNLVCLLVHDFFCLRLHVHVVRKLVGFFFWPKIENLDNFFMEYCIATSAYLCYSTCMYSICLHDNVHI